MLSVASVSSVEGMVVVTARAGLPSCTTEEFDKLVLASEHAYTEQTAPFVLIFDLTALQRAPPVWQCTRWMRLFVRVRDTTRRFLQCSCVCTSSPLIITGVRVFRTFYDPIKPMHVIPTLAQAHAIAKSR